MSLTEDVQSLRNVPMFAKVDPSRLKLMAFTSDRNLFRPGEVIVRQGDLGDHAYVILRGDVEVLVDTDDGLLKVTELSKHDMIGDIAILCDMPRTATVRALTEVETLCLSKELFLCLVKEFPEMAVEVMRVLALRLERMTRLYRHAVYHDKPA